MTHLEVRTPIAAPPEVCFDFARDVSFHARSLAHTGERVTVRPEHDLLCLGDEVEFEGRHLGVRQRLRARIESFDRPRHFRDVMVRGAFRSFAHDHEFEPSAGGTVMTDRLTFAAPFRPLGVVVERLVLVPYLRRLIAGRGQEIKAAAERASAAEPPLSGLCQVGRFRCGRHTPLLHSAPAKREGHKSSAPRF